MEDSREIVETRRLAHLNALDAEEIGQVSLLRYELVASGKRDYRRRWKAAMTALEAIGSATTIEQARGIAEAALLADPEIRDAAPLA